MQDIKKILLCILCSFGLYANQITLLIKIPTRSRPHQFFRNLDKFYQHLSFTVPYKFLITCDQDDDTMNNPAVMRRLKSYPNLEFSFSQNSSKVEAFNKDIETVEFDMVLAAHDDMEPIVKNFDKIIVDTMVENFPNLDGVLNFNDGFIGSQCNTLPIMGKKFYERFGYLYHPAYKALVCNVELTMVSKILKKEKAINSVIIRHNHPAWGAGQKDSLYDKNEKYHQQDLALFLQRRSTLFDIAEEDISLVTPKRWSILICTIEGREEKFEKLCEKLKEQTKKLGLTHEIEILSFKDKRGEHTVGFKRNQLLAASQGEYVSYIDDDDDVSEDFIGIIYEKLCRNPDCVSLVGIITVDGANAKKFIHSIKFNRYFEENNTYFRPPNHLNPIKRSIAVQFTFPEKSVGEDTDWAMAIARSELLKKEAIIDTPYYFYLYKNK